MFKHTFVPEIKNVIMKKVLFALSVVALSFNASASGWELDRAHSSVRFAITHLLVSEVDGSFKDFKGVVKAEKEDFSDLNTEFVIQTKSVFTDNQKRDEHLRSADFFDAEKNPTIVFTSSSFEKGKDGKYELKGKLNLHGVEKEVVWNVKYSGIVKSPYGDTRTGFKAVTTIKRSDFGISPNTPEAVLSDEVEITVNLELSKK